MTKKKLKIMLGERAVYLFGLTTIRVAYVGGCWEMEAPDGIQAINAVRIMKQYTEDHDVVPSKDGASEMISKALRQKPSRA